MRAEEAGFERRRARSLKMERRAGLTAESGHGCPAAAPESAQVCGGPAVPFSEVEAVAAGWMLDFACRCLCRHFYEGNRRDLERSCDLSLTIINGLRRIEAQQVKTVCICQLLVCVMEGKSLDSHFGSDQTVSPLENALSAWTSLQKVQSLQDKLHEEIRHLIQIQAVAVHMEKGDFKEAAEVLERLFPEATSNEPLRMKLAAIIREKDPYHQFLQHFSFNLLTDKIKSYISMLLNEESDNFLMKEAKKAAEAKKAEKIRDGQGNSEPEAAVEKSFESMQRSYKHSCFLTGQAFWNLEEIQHPHRTRITKRKALQNKSVLRSTENIQERDRHLPTNKKKQRWSDEEDKKLKDGIQKFGVGNWTQILQHYDFNNRTNVMLKDRWRTMVRLNII